jgi:dienelactone hydrolase
MTRLSWTDLRAESSSQRTSQHRGEPRDAGVLAVLRYLGPWAGTSLPAGIERRVRWIGTAEADSGATHAEAVRAYEFRPTSASVPPRGVFVVLHGLHFLGPEDHRLERFCRVLAAAGHVVVAPFLTRSLALEASDETTRQVDHVVRYASELARAEALPPPAIFTISFGSLPGIQVAATRTRAELSSLVLFGGYARFEDTLRFALTGEDAQLGAMPGRDPLNVPAIFINLLSLLPGSFRREVLHAAYVDVARRTWGRPEMRATETRRPVAEEVARAHGLRGDEIELFFVGCGLADGHTITRDALARGGGAATGAGTRFADPRPALGRLTVPVFVLHGRDDDVIPWTEAHAIRAHLPAGHPHALLFSGMHGHTGTQLPHPRDVARELGVAVSIARVFAGAAVDPEAVLGAIRRP